MKSGKNQLSLFSEKALPVLKQWEYLIVLSPSEGICEAVNGLKEKVKALQVNCDSLFSKAHVTIDTYKSVNPDIIDSIGKILNGQKKFPVTLTGQAIFQHGNKKTIYLKIENPEPIKTIYTLLSKKIAKNFIPHITIAKNITSEDFETLQGILPEFDYKNQWVCDRITILKRPHDGKNKKFDIAGEILFD